MVTCYHLIREQGALGITVGGGKLLRSQSSIVVLQPFPVPLYLNNLSSVLKCSIRTEMDMKRFLFTDA